MQWIRQRRKKMIIVIVGPTGVGKTKLSVELAKKLNAEIINADSTQVYKHLNIGTAKIKEDEKERLPHHLFDIKEVDDFYTVFDYQRDCRSKIEEIFSRGKNVILVGGTGLYIKAALYDYKFQEGTTYHEYEELTNQAILDKIKTYQETDIHVNNRKRLIRLLNKLENKEEITNNKDKALYDFKIIGLTTDREKLYDIINKRADIMIKHGLKEEVTGLKSHFATSKVMQTAIGYKEFIDYFNGNKTLDEVAEEIKKNSRHYAKRQYTFFKHQFSVQWYKVDYDCFENTINEVYYDISNNE